MRRGVLALLLPVALAATVAGCDGESSFDAPAMDAGPPSARYEAECAQWAAKFCDFQKSCVGYYQPWEQQDQCVQRMTLTCELVASNPDVSFDPTRTAACPEPDSGDCSSELGHMCLGPGRAPVDAPCARNEACASGYCSPRYTPSGFPEACGYCAAVTPPCKGACTGKESCRFGSDGGAQCVVVGDIDAGCHSASDCRSAICSGGFCKSPSATGGPCGPDAGFFYCAGAHDFCSRDGKCTAEMLVSYGGSCVAGAAERLLCRGYAACDYNDNVCVPPAADGDFCDTSQALGCLPPAACVDHVCRFPDARSCSQR